MAVLVDLKIFFMRKQVYIWLYYLFIACRQLGAGIKIRSHLNLKIDDPEENLTTTWCTYLVELGF